MQRPPTTAVIAGPRGSGQESGTMLRIRSTVRDRRTLRRHTGRIIYENYATFSFPAHTRVASRPKSPARILTTLFGPPATLRAETETFCSPGDARGAGLIGEVKRPGDASAAVPGPLAVLAPSGKAYVPSPAVASKYSTPPRLRPRPCSFSSKGTPVPGSPEPSTSSGKRSSSK